MPQLAFRVPEGAFPRLETPLHMGGTDPEGNTLRVTRRYLAYNGRPLLPVMAEFHFSRYPRAYWREALLRLQACGVTIVATYVFWIHHEEVRGQFRWDEQRDLRAFVEVRHDVGLWCFLRVGPFAHGECRNGGLPDWIWDAPYKRSTDERFMAATQALYTQIHAQVAGLLFKDGGPVVGVQLENEYQGGAAGVPYIRALKVLAREAGFDVPVWTVTGWGKEASVPAGEVIPVFGAYPAAPWTLHVDPLDTRQSGCYFFLPERNPELDLTESLPDARDARYDGYPQFTCEVGAGNQLTYHRRPAIRPVDVLAIAVTMLGAGVNLLGYYMFHGGTNPDGAREPLHETLGRPGMLEYPVYSYDFQAPLGEFGNPRAAYHDYRYLHLFVREVDSRLAMAEVYFPEPFPRDVTDGETPRAALRLSPEGGFLFVNNHDRYNAAVAAIPGFAVTIESPTYQLQVPTRPVTFPAGTSAIWPVHVTVGGIEVVQATYQLLTTLELPPDREMHRVTAVFFRETPGVPGELVLDRHRGVIESYAGKRAEEAPTGSTSRLRFIGLWQGFDQPALVVRGEDGHRTLVFVLGTRDDRHLWKGQVAGRAQAVITPVNVTFDRDHLTLYGRTPGAFKAILMPSPQSPPTCLGVADLITIAETEHATTYAVAGARATLPALEWTRETGADGTTWTTRFPARDEPWTAPVTDVFLRVTYVGNYLQFFLNGRRVWDNYYRGAVAEIGLKRWWGALGGAELRVTVDPLERDDDIFFDQAPQLPRDARTACRITRVELVAEYAYDLHISRKRNK